MMPVTEDNVWHRPPRATHTNGRRGRAVRYTWAGPFNTELYDDQLHELSNSTRENLHRLANNMMQKSQACDQYGIKHWHPEARPVNGTPLQPEQRPASRGSWSNKSVMFTSADSLASMTRGLPSEPDDTSSIISTSSVPMTFCYLCTTMEEHQRHRHMKKFPARSRSATRQKQPRIAFIAPPPKQKKKVEKPLMLLEALYKVTVWTADIPGASTDANVCITMLGDHDMLPKTRLWHRQGTGSKFCFVRGSKEVFYLKGPKLGNLQMITIEHDGVEKRHGWYLERIEIQCMASKRTWVFVCKNWLSMHHADFRIKRDLDCTEKERVWREFEVTVETGKKRLAGTDANVYITVHGADGSSPKIQLKKHKGSFQKEAVDKFRIRLHDIGEIRSLRVEHDGSGLASGWFLEKVTLQDIHHPTTIYHFLYHGWLAKNEGDGHLWRELRAKKHLPREVTTGIPVQYQVIVKTGDVRHAGTDANVYVVFIGSEGKTTKLFMDDARDNFERGMEESFELKAMNVGTLKSIVLGHDNSGPGAGWFCEYVKVRRYLSRQEISEQIIQQKKLWKTHKQRHQKRLADKLNRQNADDDDNDVDDSDSEDETENGTPKRNRRVSKDERFADMFDRDGKVVKVPLYEEYFFPCSEWFATDEADGLIERELGVQKKTLFFQER